jgi:hypothetical protein
MGPSLACALVSGDQAAVDYWADSGWPHELLTFDGVTDSYPSDAANRLHNNVCIVVPEWNMVIARTNGARKDGSAGRPANVDEIWSGFFTRLGEAVAVPKTL